MLSRVVCPAVILGVALTACSDPTGSGMGRAEGLIEDVPTATPTLTGSLAGNVHVSLSADGLAWVDLGSPNGITVPLQLAGSATTVHGEVDGPIGTYSRVRLTFDGVTALILSGSTIGGTTLTTDANVTLGGPDGQVEIVIAVPSFTVDADPQVQRTIVFNLRSTLWLTLAAVQAGTVLDAALQGAVLASTRVDPR